MTSVANASEIYFDRLVAASRERAALPSLTLFDPGVAKPQGTAVAYSTAVAPTALLAKLPLVELGTLRENPTYAESAKSTVLWLKKMHAGTGTSVERKRYLARRLGLPEATVTLGAKSTDLFVSLPGGRSVPLAEAQIARALKMVNRGEIAGAVFQDLVSAETKGSLDSVWRSPSLIDSSRSYEALVEASPRLSCLEPVVQPLQQSLDENGAFSSNRLAPGGHAFFAFELLLGIARGEVQREKGRAVVAAIANGEDLNSFPDASILGWMAKDQIPIAMVTTDKTAADKKGGQIALVPHDDGNVDITIVESAQAEAAGQRELFESLGIGIGKRASFNTNLALFNIEALAGRVRGWIDEVGEEKFIEAITPDLIRNPKKQKEADGVERRYVQLEGAMGSTLLNLDRAWRRRYAEPLVHFLNVPAAKRSELFCPIKTAFDYFLQVHSDRFAIDPDSLALVDRGDGGPVSVSLDERYREVASVLESFSGASVRNLKELEVKGPVFLSGVRLAGKVRIINQTETAWSPVVLGITTLENVSVEVGPNGPLTRPWS